MKEATNEAALLCGLFEATARLLYMPAAETLKCFAISIAAEANDRDHVHLTFWARWSFKPNSVQF